MRAALVLVLCAGSAAAEEEDVAGSDVGPLERIDTIGAVSAVTWDGRPSTGFKLGINLTQRLALGAQARVRSGELVENLDLIFQLTHGHLESTFDGRAYPIRLDVFAGVGAIERQRYATGSFGAALRVRVTSWLTIDVSVRDEVSRIPRPNRFVQVPELQLALSWTSPRFYHPDDDHQP